jgi:hypothetical protein
MVRVFVGQVGRQVRYFKVNKWRSCIITNLDDADTFDLRCTRDGETFLNVNRCSTPGGDHKEDNTWSPW